MLKTDLTWQTRPNHSRSPRYVGLVTAGNRHLVFQRLAHTVDLPNEKWRILDRADTKRNLSEYEGVTDFESTLTESIIRVALEIERRVIDFGEPLGGSADIFIA